MDRWFNHPTVLKLVALALGILLWAVIHFEPPEPSSNKVYPAVDSKNITGVKIQAIGLDERRYVLLGLDPLKVNLTVHGTRKDLLTIKAEDYVVQVDLRTVGEGSHTMKLEVDFPSGIQSYEMSPSTVNVSIEGLETKEFEVDIAADGNPAMGYKAGTPIIKPSNRAHITLPKSEMSRVKRVGAAISVEGETETLKNKSVKLAAYDADGNVVENAVIDPAVVEVEIPITNPFKIVPLQFKLIGKTPAGLSIASFKPNVEQVTVYGPQEALDKLEFVEVDVQLADLQSSGIVSVPIKVVAPIIEISPKQIDIDIEVLLSSSRSLEGLPITWDGLGEGLSVKIVEPASGKADITIQGAPALLDKLQPGDVDVVADLSGRGPGTYTIPLIVNLGRFMDQVGGTSSITVEITNDVPADTEPEENVGSVIIEEDEDSPIKQ